jgi:hypothetical protein
MELPMPQRSANLVSVAGVRRTGQTDDDRQIDAGAIECSDPLQDRRALEAKLSDEIDPRSGPPSPVAPGFQTVQRLRQFEIGMAFGMTGQADGRDPMRLEQAAAADVARRPERPLAAATSPAIKRIRDTAASPRARARKSSSASREVISRAAMCGTGLKPARRSAVAVSTLWR